MKAEKSPDRALGPRAVPEELSGLEEGDGWLADEEVVARVRAGETALFEILMRRHNQRIFRVAMAVLGDEAEAEDVMQEAYVQAYSCLAQFRGEARFATWLTRIAVHEAMARGRKRRRLSTLEGVAELDRCEPVFGAPPRDPEHTAANEELRLALGQAIRTLPDGHRLVFVLRDVEGLSTEETARSLGVSSVAVRVKLHRARARMRREIDRRLESSAGYLYPFHLRRCDRVVTAVFRRLRVRSPA